jgi:hypothetical protein
LKVHQHLAASLTLELYFGEMKVDDLKDCPLLSIPQSGHRHTFQSVPPLTAVRRELRVDPPSLLRRDAEMIRLLIASARQVVESETMLELFVCGGSGYR